LDTEAETGINFLLISEKGPTKYLVVRKTKHLYAHPNKMNNLAGKGKKKFMAQIKEKSKENKSVIEKSYKENKLS
jgi:hypothetical protein